MTDATTFESSASDAEDIGSPNYGVPGSDQRLSMVLVTGGNNGDGTAVPRIGAAALAGFVRFSGGVTVTRPEEREVPQTIGRQEISVPVPTVDGILPGEVAGVDFWIPLRQLRLAAKEDLLCSRYHPGDDPDFEQLSQALGQLGDEIPSLPVLQANRVQSHNGQPEEPVFLVCDRPEVYYALIALNRSRARVHLPSVARPGAILFQALAQHGQLRREPSQVEVAQAAKRLKEYYGYTLQEIAQMQARNSEDNTAPSITQVYYQILVAGLPEAVLDLLYKRHILWTHARNIAEFCANDAALCVQLATYVVQNTRIRVDALTQLIHRLKDERSRLVTDSDDVVREIPIGKPDLHTTPTPAAGAPKSLVLYQRLMAAPSQQVYTASRLFTVHVISTESEDRVAVPAHDLEGLRTWLNDRRANTSVRELEATLLGYLEAVRASAQQAGYLGKDGAIQKVIDSERNAGKTLSRAKTG